MPHDTQPSPSAATASARNTAASIPLPYKAESVPVRFLYFVLEKALDLLIGLIIKHGKPGPLTDAQRRTLKIVKDSIYARLVVEGYISRGRGVNRYPDWDDLNTRLYHEGSDTPAGAGVTAPAFIDGLEKLVGERFSPDNAVQPLINGPASFEQRYKLIDSAKQSIYIATWKLYGDHTGMKTVDALLARRQQEAGIDIRLMVDGNVAVSDPSSLTQLKRLVDGGIPVAFYHHEHRPFDGLHYKQMLVDGASEHPISISGGMNIGDVYSHGFGTSLEKEPDRRQWRDTDIRIDGPNARDDYHSFIRMWNDQASYTDAVEPFRQTLTPITWRNDLPEVASFGEARIMTVIDEPGPSSRQKITLAMVRSISAAMRNVDIENAYFMDVPAIRNALVDAMKRGVCIRVLTNSAESSDERAVCVPILKALFNLLKDAEAAGTPPERCQVYVRNKLHPDIRNADTLHSKFMVVDKEFSQVTSHNIHGRSLRLEVEGAHFILDKGLAESLAAQFEKDLADARCFRSANDIEFPKDFLSRVMRRVNLDPVLV